MLNRGKEELAGKMEHIRKNRKGGKKRIGKELEKEEGG